MYLIENLIEKYDEKLVLFLALDYYGMLFKGDNQLSDNMRLEFEDLVLPFIEEHGSDVVYSELIGYLNTDSEVFIPNINKIRVFNLPENMNCFDCQAEYKTSELLQQALSFHFNYLADLQNCGYCFFGISETHFVDMRCVECHLQWNFELKHTDKTKKSKSWFIKLDSYESNQLINEYSEGMYKVSKREFSVGIDLEKKPNIETIEVMLDDSAIRSDSLISCNDAMHFYLVDLAATRVLDTGPIYCPGCDSFHSEMKISRRSKAYQGSKHDCFHEFLILCQGDGPFALTCPRCEYIG